MWLGRVSQARHPSLREAQLARLPEKRDASAEPTRTRKIDPVAPLFGLPESGL